MDARQVHGLVLPEGERGVRLSVSDLESYRYWCDSEDSDVATLIARLSHTDAPTPAMEAGRAFAKLFESAEEGAYEGVDVDGWRFRFDLDAHVGLPVIRELKAEVEFQTPSGPVTLVGKVDSLDGMKVRDQKLTERFDAERYLDSLQWRAYLVMFGAREFVYDVFLCRYDGKQVAVTEYHPLSFYAYPAMRSDVEKAVCELAEVVAKFLPERMAA